MPVPRLLFAVSGKMLFKQLIMTENRSEDSYIFHDILPAFADYGYPTAGDSENLKIKSDIKIKMGSGSKEPDVVYYAEEIPVLIVEAKKEGKSKTEAENQVKSYIRNFPIEKYSKDGRPPQYAAVTIGKKIFFYKYEYDINDHGGITDRLEETTDVFSYDELRLKYGLEEARKPTLTPDTFKDLFYQIVSALDTANNKEITPEIILKTIKLLYEFLKDQTNYSSRSPYTDLDGHPDRQRWIRGLLHQYDWSSLNPEIAKQFRKEILRSFQGSEQLNQYITPWEVVIFMVNLARIREDDSVLDFECGSGGFLAAAIEAGVKLENIRGVDIADLPYYTAKLFLALNFNVSGNDIDEIPVENNNGLYFWGNDWSTVIGNPAGGGKYDPENELKDIKKVYENLEKDIDQNGKVDSASEYNFSIQQAVRSCKVGGRICLVLPEGFFSNSSAELFRKYFAKYCKVKAIISLPRGVFYKGTTTKSVSAGHQVATMKMSILYAEKVTDVVDESGIEIDFRDLDYPVFLASVQKPTPASDDEHWLGKVLERVLENYRKWEDSNELAANNEPVKFQIVKRAEDLQQKLDMDDEDEEIAKMEEQKKKRPASKEETVIPVGLEDIF